MASYKLFPPKGLAGRRDTADRKEPRKRGVKSVRPSADRTHSKLECVFQRMTLFFLLALSVGLPGCGLRLHQATMQQVLQGLVAQRLPIGWESRRMSGPSHCILPFLGMDLTMTPFLL